MCVIAKGAEIIPGLKNHKNVIVGILNHLRVSFLECYMPDLFIHSPPLVPDCCRVAIMIFLMKNTLTVSGRAGIKRK
jgi:hypothetical protein